jgi:hypothetical protein
VGYGSNTEGVSSLLVWEERRRRGGIPKAWSKVEQWMDISSEVPLPAIEAGKLPSKVWGNIETLSTYRNKPEESFWERVFQNEYNLELLLQNSMHCCTSIGQGLQCTR